MTTIKLKNGSGAPTAGDLAQGEPALDLTNKRLYTEDSGGSVIEVGTNPTSVTTGDITATGTATFAGLTTTGSVSFGDNDKAIFGAGADLQIYHDGSNSYIEDSGTGNLNILANEFAVYEGNGTDLMIGATPNGAVTLSHNALTKLATSPTGIDVTGVITTDGMTTSADINFGDNDKAVFGAGSDLQIYHDGSNSYIWDNGTGLLQLRTNGSEISLVGQNGTEFMGRFQQDGAVKLYYDNAQKFATTSTGIDVTGTVTADGLSVDGSSSGTLNNVNFLNTNSGATTTANRIGLGITNSAGAAYTYIEANEDGIDAYPHLNFYTGVTATKRLEIEDNGDISFYEDTGTTAKLFWDASAESLGIGTSSPDTMLHLSDTLGGAVLRLERNDTAIVATDQYGAIEFEGQDANAGASGVRASMRAVAEASVGQTSLTFSTAGSGASEEEAMRIDSSGNVGIGTSSFTSSSTGRTVLEVNGSSASALVNLSVNGTRQGYIYTDTTDMNVYNVDSGSLNFGTSNTERMRLDASGNLLVGTTSESTWESAAGFRTRNSGSTTITRDGNPPLYVNRLTSDGTIVQFQKGTTTVGSIGTDSSGVIYMGGNTKIKSGTAAIIPTNNDGTTANGTKDLGFNNGRWNNLYLAGGVYLGGTGSANKLDDYEEGTWDPEFGGEGSDPTIVYNTQKGSYTKVGNLVTVTGQIITVSRSGGSGNLTVKNLPFTTQSGEAPFSGIIGFNFNWVSGEEPNGAIANQGGTKLILYKDTSINSHNEVDDILASGNTYLYFTLTYFTA